MFSVTVSETHSHNIMVIIELTNKVKPKETHSCVLYEVRCPQHIRVHE